MKTGRDNEFMRCKNCAFAEMAIWGHVDKCRRNAPVAIANGMGGFRSVFPDVSDSDWCGDFSPSLQSPSPKEDLCPLMQCL